MAAPGLQLCAAAALLLLLCLPLRARADEHEHTVRRVLASPGGARAAAPASPPPGPAAAEGRRRPQRPGERGRAGSDGPRPEGGGGAVGGGAPPSPRGASFLSSPPLGLFWVCGPGFYGIGARSLQLGASGTLGEGLPELSAPVGTSLR